MSEYKTISSVYDFTYHKFFELNGDIFVVADGKIYLYKPDDDDSKFKDDILEDNEIDDISEDNEMLKYTLKDDLDLDNEIAKQLEYITEKLLIKANNHTDSIDDLYEEARNQRNLLFEIEKKREAEEESRRLDEEAEARKQEELEKQIKKNEEIKNKPLPKCVDRAFDLSVINLDCNYPIEKIIDGVINFSEQLKKDTNKVKSCCILLTGVSGTGKTEFAKYLASLTGLGFKHKRASDILNKYVGETEKTITSLFHEASLNKNVLLIDEADSLLRDRSLGTHSWEVTQVNEFLCRMEEFRGILICSSNLINNFDKAAMRRFVFKIRFRELTDEGKEILAKKYFEEVCVLPEDISEIKKINDLRPGDFKAVRDRLLIVYRDKVSFNEVLEELKLETSYRIDENLIATL